MLGKKKKGHENEGLGAKKERGVEVVWRGSVMW